DLIIDDIIDGAQWSADLMAECFRNSQEMRRAHDLCLGCGDARYLLETFGDPKATVQRAEQREATGQIGGGAPKITLYRCDLAHVAQHICRAVLVAQLLKQLQTLRIEDHRLLVITLIIGIHTKAVRDARHPQLIIEQAMERETFAK